MSLRSHRVLLFSTAFTLLLIPRMGAAVSPTTDRPMEFVVEPYYVFPADQGYHPEYEEAVREHIRQVRKWYQQQVGRNFHLGRLQVIQAEQDYLTMRCGSSPSAECIGDREQLPFWFGSAFEAVGGLEPGTIKWIFSQGGGGVAGGTLFADFAGFAVTGDWTLEPISGVVEPEAITCDFSDGWQCAIDPQGNGTPYGAGPHELGHGFGLHHPDGYDGMSLMKWHGDYPSTGLLPHEIVILRETPWFNNHAFDADAPHLDFENQDVVHWGEPLWLTGSGFAEGDEVEFRDATRSVRLVAPVVSSALLQVIVPTDMGPGYMRIWRGDIRSNVVPVNVHP